MTTLQLRAQMWQGFQGGQRPCKVAAAAKNGVLDNFWTGIDQNADMLVTSCDRYVLKNEGDSAKEDKKALMGIKRAAR